MEALSRKITLGANKENTQLVASAYFLQSIIMIGILQYIRQC